jgi:Phospholipase_D-nuclease N-terminal
VASGSKKRWRDLSTRQRRGAVAATLVQLGLLGAALADLRQRAPDQINGPRRMWVAVAFVNFVGPLAYFAFGRKR